LVNVDLDKMFLPFVEKYKCTTNFKLTTNLSIYFQQMRSLNPSMPKYIIETYSKSNNIKYYNRFKQFIKLCLLTVVNGTGFKKVYYKKNKKPYYSKSSRMNNFEYFFYVSRLRRNNKKLLKHYLSFCKEPDYSLKYLYFASSYQPEAVTATNAGYYDDLLLVLDILSHIIPEEWVIFYKEPRYIFEDPLGKANLRRDWYYWNRINSFQNIQMISPDVDTFQLIDNSQAVATVSGTAAWEAAVRGKPAMSFGSAWYMGCKSIFWIKTLQDAQEAMQKILNGFKPDPSDVERYAAAIEKVAVKGMIHRNFNEAIKKCKDPKFEMERIGKAIYEAYTRHYT
jgi:hypothetical protein